MHVAYSQMHCMLESLLAALEPFLSCSSDARSDLLYHLKSVNISQQSQQHEVCVRLPPCRIFILELSRDGGVAGRVWPERALVVPGFALAMRSTSSLPSLMAAGVRLLQERASEMI